MLAKLDQRTKEARMVREARAELIAHIGNDPSAIERALIDQAVTLRLHIAIMDRRTADGGQMMSERDGRQYLAWANAYCRLLRQLGLKGEAQKPPSLSDLLSQPRAA